MNNEYDHACIVLTSEQKTCSYLRRPVKSKYAHIKTSSHGKNEGNVQMRQHDAQRNATY